jgi:hypothetical protein
VSGRESVSNSDLNILTLILSLLKDRIVCKPRFLPNIPTTMYILYIYIITMKLFLFRDAKHNLIKLKSHNFHSPSKLSYIRLDSIHKLVSERK